VTELQQIFRDTRRILLDAGWCQGASRDNVGRSCLLAALYTAIGPRPHAPAVMVLRRALGLPLHVAGCLGAEVAVWQDAPGRTVADVIDLLDRAIIATIPDPQTDWTPAQRREWIAQVLGAGF